MHQPDPVECLSVFKQFKHAFEIALTSELDIHSADQMDTVLAGAMQYARWGCNASQITELRKLWIQWKTVYTALDLN